MTTLNNRQELLLKLAEGACVITPNNRLAMQLLNDYAATALYPVLAKPACVAYQAFLVSLYTRFAQSNHPVPRLLSTEQCRFLWQQILTEHLGSAPNQGLIQQVQDSWARCHLWQIGNPHPAFENTGQTRLFQQWRTLMEQRLHALNAITAEQWVPYFLTQAVNIPLPDTLVWACFDDYTPQQQALQVSFAARGVTQHHVDWLQSNNETRVYAAKDNGDEYRQLLYWLHEQLSRGQQRIGVVVPDLQQQAQALYRLMTDHFSADAFNVSLGRTLTDYSLVSHALCWLSLESDLLTRQQANLLLYSPFVGHSHSEFLERSHYGQHSTMLREMRLDFSLFIQELASETPKLAALLKNLHPYPAAATPQQWVHHFYQRLNQLQFPGEYPLDSANYQCYQRFLLLLDEFKSLEFLSPPMQKKHALNVLTELAKGSIFQPQKSTSAPIQIMGLLEAAGLAFDCLWVSGLTEDCLPQKTRPSAFIPLSLQRDKHMPYALPDREFALAEKTLNRLRNAAAECILSYPSQTQDKPNRPSPLLQGIPSYAPFSIPAIEAEPSALESVSDNYLFPVQEGESIAGGTALLANQAKCPFRAFAAHRLHAKAATEVSDGPDARERGQIIHRVMEIIWTLLKNQASLLSKTPEALDELIEEAIEQALKPYTRVRKHSFPPLVQTVEVKRLKRLVHASLEWERQRPAFAVEALEQNFNLPLSGIDFKVRIDRMDTMENGKHWVIDYKSSIQSTPWNEERPTEPQLLLYALLSDSINTISLAELKNGQLQCRGLSEEKQELAGLRSLKKEESWQDYRERWRQQLSALADEFVQGHCPPKPAKESLCQVCDFQSLCRFGVDEDTAVEAQ
ncbi:PD-(D/E)XK nuclease family protein [Legionella sp. MW5194]|uniref:PD-(D/E)XK nuclease family protein n=1 Tax=Legionella sp. MW5194 TaxID=2662448 RepID=UPI00193E2F03|nr:PD-(D/E)XK nuclease family protein [Legionella sp. MW5194]QRN03220.1 PD-(D/E)XK nuclease family protein [Legionella sp. MW5194]